jgi:tRNA/tmRNA/rRNA uracil-C5-methylase (TrmA/RlmC/RlmD family)
VTPEPSAVRTGTVVQLRIGAVAHGGHCVARHEGRVVFVRHALPGELADVRLTQARAGDRFWRGDAVRVLEASPDRVEPRCPVARPGGCGGCDWQHAALPAQRELKAQVVLEQLARLGGVQWPRLEVEAVPGDDGGLGWRTRVRFAVDAGGRAGLRKHRSHDVVGIDGCPIADPEIDAVGVPRHQWPGAGGVEVVAAHTTEGGAERLVVVEPAAPTLTGATHTGPARVAPGPAAPGWRRGRPVSADPAAGEPGRLRIPAVDAPASLAVRGAEGVERVRGRGWVREEVLVDGEVRGFRVSGAGFWQVHPGAAQALLDAVLATTRPVPGERALDLYCGVGLFAAGLAARVGPGGSVVGVESEPRAVADARRNLHDRPWVRLENDGVADALAAGVGDADLVVLDPPRTGAGRDVVGRVLALRPRVVAYVACDPAALARDVATATGLGYRLDALRAFDLFPMTHHVECVATLVPASG